MSDDPLLVPVSTQGEWAAKRFYGDPQRAAAYLPVAYALLGQVKQRMAFGGVGYGIQMANLPDGTQIRVIRNGEQNIVEIITSQELLNKLFNLLRAFYINSISELVNNKYYASAVTLVPTDKKVLKEKSRALSIGSFLIQGYSDIFTLQGGGGGHVPLSDLAWAMSIGGGDFFKSVIYPVEFSESGYGTSLYKGTTRLLSFTGFLVGGRMYYDADKNPWFLSILIDEGFRSLSAHDQYSQYYNSWGVGSSSIAYTGTAYEFRLFNLKKPEDEGKLIYKLIGTEDHPICSPRSPWFFSEDGLQCWHYDHQSGRYFIGTISGNPPATISIKGSKSYKEWEEPEYPPGESVYPLAIIPVINADWEPFVKMQIDPNFDESTLYKNSSGTFSISGKGIVENSTDIIEFHETPLGWCSDNGTYDWWDEQIEDFLPFLYQILQPKKIVRTSVATIDQSYVSEGDVDVYTGSTVCAYSQWSSIKGKPKNFICTARQKTTNTFSASVSSVKKSGQMPYSVRTSRCPIEYRSVDPILNGSQRGTGTYKFTLTTEIVSKFGVLFSGTIERNYTITASSDEYDINRYGKNGISVVSGTLTVSVDFPKLLIVDQDTDRVLYEHRYTDTKIYNGNVTLNTDFFSSQIYYLYSGTSTNYVKNTNYVEYTGIGAGTPPSYQRKNRLKKLNEKYNHSNIGIVSGAFPSAMFSFSTRKSSSVMYGDDEICRDYCFYEPFSFDVPQPLTSLGSGKTAFKRTYKADVARDFYDGNELICQWEKEISGEQAQAPDGVMRYTSNGYRIDPVYGLQPYGSYQYVPGSSSTEEILNTRITYKFSDDSEISSVTYSSSDLFIKYISPLYINPKTKTAFVLEITSNKDLTKFSYEPKFLFFGRVLSDVVIEIPENNYFYVPGDYLFFDQNNNKISYAYPGFSQPNNLILTLSERNFPDIKEKDRYFICWTLTYLNYGRENFDTLDGVVATYVDGEIRSRDVSIKLLGESKLLPTSVVINDQEIQLKTHFPVKVF